MGDNLSTGGASRYQRNGLSEGDRLANSPSPPWPRQGA
jgi:hypothetical protein